MDDNRIIELYWKRSEAAISETASKYGGYCYSIAYNILTNPEDAEESVSDTYLAAWNGIPPHRPNILSTFLGKITRRISIDRWRTRSAYKRGGGQIVLALEELEECVPGGQSVEQDFARRELARAFNRFLDTLTDTERNIFLRRYWYMDAIADIADSFGFSQSKVTSMLHRIRGRLRKQLEKEGFV